MTSDFNGFTGNNDPVYYPCVVEKTDGNLIGKRTQLTGAELVEKFALHIAKSGLTDDSLVTMRECKDALQHCLE